VLSLSRAAQGGFVVAIMVFFGLTFFYSEINRVYKISSASVISLGFLTSFWLIPESMLRRLTLNELASSFESRISIWETHWNQLEGNLMFGLNFSRDLTQEFINAPTHEHNMYLRFVTDSGILGFIGFMILFSSVFVLAVFNMKKNSNFLKLIHFGLLSSFIGPLLIRSIVAKRYDFYLELFVSLLIASSLLNSNYTFSSKNKSVESSKP
jgi:O-antigen ligase